MNFENRSETPLSNQAFAWRFLKYFALSALLLAASLGVGMLGFHWTVEGMTWTGAFYNASMILTGMGPALGDSPSEAAMLFAGWYALFSAIAFLTTVGVAAAPLAHRFLHLLHFDGDEGND